MEHRDLIAELGGELPQHLRRQADFGNEHDGAFSGFERVGDEAQIDLRLAAAGHAEKQRGTRFSLVHECGHAVVGLLLLRRQHGQHCTRHIGKVRRTHPLLIARTQNALLYHVAQGGIARARHIGKLLLAHPDTVRERGNDVLPRRAPAHAVHRLAACHVERQHFFGLVAGFLYRVAVIGEDSLPGKRVERAARAFSEAFADFRERKRLPGRIEQPQHLALVPLAPVQGIKVGVRYQRVGFVALEPQSGREHGAHAVEIRAVQPLTHPRRELQLLGRQHRLFVERFHDRLQTVFARVLSEAEHHAFCPFIAKAERHENTCADLHLFPQLVRHTVGI